ncbi:hypothetical protein V6R21_01935 [Limibacter armeniacum]|uniref:hypothetical protein n=1 Tax=Limibacter armeniacum TaxID=466084 RepID=UPI002FE6361C
MVKRKEEDLKRISNILVADAYFSRKPFVDKVIESGLTLVSKLASNAVLRYRYTGE